MNTQRAIRTIKNFIEHERKMRKRVFGDRRDTRLLETKLKECDDAEACLNYLAAQLQVEPEAETLPLFG